MNHSISVYSLSCTSMWILASYLVLFIIDLHDIQIDYRYLWVFDSINWGKHFKYGWLLSSYWIISYDLKRIQFLKKEKNTFNQLIVFYFSWFQCHFLNYTTKSMILSTLCKSRILHVMKDFSVCKSKQNTYIGSFLMKTMSLLIVYCEIKCLYVRTLCLIFYLINWKRKREKKTRKITLVWERAKDRYSRFQA